MGIDLNAPFIHHVEASTRSWPKCHQCSQRLGRPYAVEVFGLVGRERPKQVRDKQRIIAEVECHGARQEFALDVPIWMAEANIHDAFGQTACFINLGGGRYGTGVITKEKRGVK